jgi:UDP-N-acetylmuramate--alanine ligase
MMAQPSGPPSALPHSGGGKRRVHLMGIGGAGVSALARVFLARGDQVSGCDERESATTRSLAAEGARISIGHDPSHTAGAELLVYTGAARGPAVEEVNAARAAGLRVLTRAEMLAELIAASESVAVAGTHGKTTVTFMVGHVLMAAGWDPTVLVGDGSSSRVGRSRWLVAEADESDGSLVLHRPRHGVLTSVEFDHPDHFASIDQVDELFRGYLAAIPGVVAVCADYARAAAMPVTGKRVTYGFAEGADYRCVPNEGQARLAPTFPDEGDAFLPAGRFRIDRHGKPLVPLRLVVPGQHNRQNATGALAMAVELGVEPRVAADALASFPGARRRLERLGTWRGAEIYDDYGHHPTKVRATVAAARELEPRRLVLVFQPHRFTRFQALRDEFAESLCGADEVVVTEIYPAGEENPGKVSGRELAERVPGARFVADLDEAKRLLEDLLEEGDLVLLMGAGDIWKLGDGLANAG